MERNSSAHIGILQKQIDDIKRNVSQNSDTIDIVHTHLKVDVTNVNMSLQQQIDSVRKMEGPMVGTLGFNGGAFFFNTISNLHVLTFPLGPLVSVKSYIKPVFGREGTFIIALTNGSLMKVKSIAECSKGSILQYF